MIGPQPRLSGLAVLVLVVAGLGRAAGNGPASIAAVDTVGQYLEAFDAAYRLPAAEHDPVAMARSALREAESWWLPRVSLRESLHGGTGGTVLDLSVSGEMLVLDATAASDLAAARADMTYRTAVAAQARVDATVAFLQDLVAYALLTPAARLAVATSEAIEDPSSVSDPLALPPSRRGEYEAALGARDAAAWLSAAVRDVEGRLAQRLSVPVSTLAAPSVAEVAAFVAEALDPLVSPHLSGTAARPLRTSGLDEPVARCLARAPALDVATARRDLAYARRASAGAPDVLLELTTGLDTTVPLAGTAAGPPASARVGLEARFVLPDSWPVAGTLSATAALTGLSQTAEVSWPPRTQPVFAAVDPGEDHAAEVTAATWDARASLQALEQARAESERRQRALAWAVLDSYPEVSVTDASSLASDPLSRGWLAAGLPLDPALTRLRIEAVLARLGELTAALDLVGFCGTLPGSASVTAAG